MGRLGRFYCIAERTAPYAPATARDAAAKKRERTPPPGGVRICAHVPADVSNA